MSKKEDIRQIRNIMNTSIRLNNTDRHSIIKNFRHYFGKVDHLWLFGSRTDINKHGGDIDLYIETYCNDLDLIAQKKIKFLVNLKNDIGDQKIDIIINTISTQKKLPIYDEAKSSGIQLA